MFSCFRPAGPRAHRDQDKPTSDVRHGETEEISFRRGGKGGKGGIGAFRHQHSQSRDKSPRFFHLSLQRRKKHISLDPLNRPEPLPSLVHHARQPRDALSQELTEQSVSGQSSNVGAGRAWSSTSSPSLLLSYGHAGQDATPPHARHRSASLPPSADRSVDQSPPSVASGHNEVASVSSRTDVLTPTASATLHTSPTPVVTTPSRVTRGVSPLQKACTSTAASADHADTSVYSFVSSSRSHDDHPCIAQPPFNTPPPPGSPSPNYLTPLGTIPATALPLHSPLRAPTSPRSHERSAATPPALTIPETAPSHDISPTRPGAGISQELSTPSSLPLPPPASRRHFTATAETMTHVTNPVFSPPRSVQHTRLLGAPLPSPRSLPTHALLQHLPSTAPSSVAYQPPPLPPWRSVSEVSVDDEGAALDAVTSTAKDGSIELDFSQSPAPSVTPSVPTDSPGVDQGRLSIPVAAPVTTPAPRDIVAGRFLIRRFVGATPFAQVFAANDLEAGSVPCSVRLPAPGAPAAAALVELGRLQWLRNAVAAPAGASAFARVLSMPALLGHGALVAIESLEESAPARLRRIRDGTMRQFSAWDLKCIARQLLQGAAHMHANGIVHGDLSPHSVFFKSTAGTQLRLVDVGCGAFPVSCTAAAPPAAAAGGIVAEVQRAQAAAAAARRSCAAPEAATVPPTVSDKADVYAIGCILFYLATGRHLHSGKQQAGEPPAGASTTATPASPGLSSVLQHSHAIATPPGSLDSGTTLSPAARLLRGPLSLAAAAHSGHRGPASEGGWRAAPPRGPASESGMPQRPAVERTLTCPDVWAGLDRWQAAAMLQSTEAAPGLPTSLAREHTPPHPQSVGQSRLRSLGSCSIGSEPAGADSGPIARGWAGVMARASLRRPFGARREGGGPDTNSPDDVAAEAGPAEPRSLVFTAQALEHASRADNHMQQRLRLLASTPIAYLLRDLLWDDPAARPTAQEALHHPFFFGAHSM